MVHRQLTAGAAGSGSRSRCSPLAIAARARSARRGEPPGRDRPLPVVHPADPRSTSASTSPGTGSARTPCTRSPGPPPNDAGLGLRSRVEHPRHDLGDSFQLTFNQPGTYTFQCKLHSGVRGTVHRLRQARRPEQGGRPGPEDQRRPDAAAPERRQAPSSSSFGRKGTTLRMGHEREVDASTPSTTRCRNGHRGKFAGWHDWHAHVGFNDARVRQQRPALRREAGPLHGHPPGQRHEQQHQQEADSPLHDRLVAAGRDRPAMKSACTGRRR